MSTPTTEARRQRVRRPHPITQIKQDDEASNPKPSGSKLTKADITKFTKAVEHRVGRTAYEDWRVIGAIYAKASRIALDESGQESRHNPVYKRAFSRIIEVLPPIANTEATCERYRLCLLSIEEAEPAFSKWYDKAEPLASNPVDLWRMFRDQPKAKQADEAKERTFTQHQQELARVQQDAADKISQLTEQLQGQATPSLEQVWAGQDDGDAAATFETMVRELIDYGLAQGLSLETMRARIDAVLRLQETSDDAA